MHDNDRHGMLCFVYRMQDNDRHDMLCFVYRMHDNDRHGMLCFVYRMHDNDRHGMLCSIYICSSVFSIQLNICTMLIYTACKHRRVTAIISSYLYSLQT